MSNQPSLAKISRPRLFSVVPRERLFALLDENNRRSLIWISGPPGSGKTTLVASYLDARQTDTLWYQVDAGDADPASLFRYLSEAVGTSEVAGASQLPRFVPGHHSDIDGFSRLYFRSFFLRLHANSVLVLDNFQEVLESGTLHEILRLAIAEVPPSITLIVISRVEPPASFVRLKANGAMVQIGWEDLQLTLDEVRSIAAIRNVTDDWLVKALHQQSQGWAAGITLMLERLGHFDDGSRELPTETRESVFHYFANLIFDQAAEATRHVLLSIAFLPRVTERLASELSGRHRAGEMLDDLYRRRMFIDRRLGPEPVYQFHALFLDFLRTRAREALNGSEYANLLARSTNVLHREGDFDATMEVTLLRSDRRVAREIVLAEAASLLDQGRRQTLLHWIERLPQDCRQEDAWLTYWRRRAEVQTDPMSGAKTLEHALELFQDANDRAGRMECLTALLNGLFVGFHGLDSLNRWLDDLLAEVQAAPEYASPDAELQVLGVLCPTPFHVRPWHQLMEVIYKRVEDLHPQCRTPGVGLIAAMGALVVCGLCCDFERGDRLVIASEALAFRDSASPADAAWWCAQIGWLRFAQARYEEALDYLLRGQKIAEGNGLQQLTRQLMLWRFTITWRVVGWPEALTLMEEIERMPITRQLMAQAQILLFKGRIACYRQQREEVARLATLAYEFALKTQSRLQELIFAVSIVNIYLDINLVAEAKPFIQRTQELAQRAEIYRCWRAVPLLLGARGAQLEGHQDVAETKLRAALAEASAGSARYCLRFCDWTMPPMFCLALDRGIELNLVRDLIRLFRLKPPKGAPDNWPWPVRIITLGRFGVQVHDEPVEFSRKVPRKTLQLLKAIVAQGGREVSEETLCDALWPDEEGDAARHVLSITVLRLRKLLGSNDAVIQQGGKVSLNPELCWVDSWQFESRISDAGTAAQQACLYTAAAFYPRMKASRGRWWRASVCAGSSSTRYRRWACNSRRVEIWTAP